MIAGFHEQIITRDAIFINTMPGILKYDYSGKFIKKIGGVGQGPMEYSQYRLIAINELQNKLFVYNVFESTILTYTLEGAFVSRLKIKNFPASFSAKNFYYLNNTYYIFRDISPSQKEHIMWAVIDTTGNVISYKKDIKLSSISEGPMYNNHISSRSTNNSVLYWNLYNDTIFRISSDTITHPYIWAQNKYCMTPERFNSEERNKCIIPENLIDSKNYLFFNWVTGGFYESHLCIYFKKENSFIEVEKCIRNDLDGGISFGYIDDFVQLGEHEYLIYKCLPEDLIKVFLDSDNPKAKSIAESIDGEGNPVIIMNRLKT